MPDDRKELVAMHDVFISYARGDRSRVKRLADALVAARGWSVWWDPELEAGEAFPRRIQEAVGDSRCVLVVWSARSVASDWVAAEATEGWERDILVPVRLDDCEPPMPFRQTHTVDLGLWKGSTADGAFLELLDGVERVLARGEAIDAGELEARERRRRTHRRRVVVRRTAATAAILVAAVALGLAARTYFAGQDVVRAAEALAGHADGLRLEVTTFTPEEQKRRWWSLLRGERLDRLELAVLLAAEAAKRARTERTEWSLRDTLALLPWSDWNHIIEFDNAPCVLDFTRDGRLLAAGGGRGDTIVVRPGAKGTIARIPHGGTGGRRYWEDKRGRFFGIRGSCHVLDVSPAADILATAGPDESAALWDALTGRELRRLAHEGVVTAVAFDGGGSRVATATESGTVALWDVESGRRLHSMSHGDASYWVGFSPSSRSVASASLDRTVRIWEPGTGAERLRLAHDGVPEAAVFSPNEQMIATFGRRIATRLWNADTGAEVWRLPDGNASVAGVVFDAPGRIMVVGRTDGEVTWWDVAKRAPLFSVSEDSVLVASDGADSGPALPHHHHRRRRGQGAGLRNGPAGQATALRRGGLRRPPARCRGRPGRADRDGRGRSRQPRDGDRGHRDLAGGSGGGGVRQSQAQSNPRGMEALRRWRGLPPDVPAGRKGGRAPRAAIESRASIPSISTRMIGRSANLQAALMLAVRITLPHFSVSWAMSIPKLADDPASVVAPNSAKRALIFGSARPALIALLSFSMTSIGVFLGAHTPLHPLAS
jgi:WD40 repeat protein